MSFFGPSLEESLSSLSSASGSNAGSGSGRSFPTPPRVHWFALLLIGGCMNVAGAWMSRRTGLPQLRQIVSSEVFLFFWLCVQAAFVQRLKPQKFTLLTTMTAGVLLAAAFLIHDSQRFSVLAGCLAIGGSILLLVDLFRMRRVLVDHYNSVEPYGLSLNGIWLLFLGPLYLQYHLLKIAMWKDRQP